MSADNNCTETGIAEMIIIKTVILGCMINH